MRFVGVLALSLGCWSLGCWVLGCRSVEKEEEPGGTARPAVPQLTAAASASPSASAATAPGACPARQPLTTVRWSADTRYLATSCASEGCLDPPRTKVDVWDVEAGAVVHSADTTMARNVGAFHEGGWLLTHANPTTGMGHIQLWKLANWELVWDTDFYCSGEADFDPSGRRAYVVGCDGQMAMFDTVTRKTTERPSDEAHLGGDVGVMLSFVDGGKRLRLIDDAQGPQFLDPLTLRRTSALFSGFNSYSVVPSPDGSVFAAVDATDGSLGLWRAGSGRLFRHVGKPDIEDAYASLEWPVADRIFARHNGQPRSVKEIDLKSGASKTYPIATSISPSECVPDVMFLHRLDMVLSTDEACKVSASERTTGNPLWEQQLPAPRPSAVTGAKEPAAVAIVASPSQASLAIMTREEIAFFDARTGAMHGRAARAAGDPSNVEWSDDERFVAWGDDLMHFLRTKDGAQVALGLFELPGGLRQGVVVSSTRYSGLRALADCIEAFDAAAATRSERATLLADFFAGRALE